MWRKENEFRDLLHKAAKKATKETLDAIANLALEEDKQVLAPPACCRGHGVSQHNKGHLEHFWRRATSTSAPCL
jgi:hypothetical protein